VNGQFTISAPRKDGSGGKVLGSGTEARELMPDLLRRISDWTPLGAAVRALQTSMQGAFPGYAPLLVLAGYALLFGSLAVKQSKWE